jgi:DDE family transposase
MSGDSRPLLAGHALRPAPATTARASSSRSKLLPITLFTGCQVCAGRTRTARLIAEHAALRNALGGSPSEWACYRFTVKLRENAPALSACLNRVAASLAERLPDMGRDVAVDASDMPAYGNGQRFLNKHGPERERYSDPDASWGHRSAVSTRKGGGFYGYRLHAAVCSRTGLPLAWEVKSARAHETTAVANLLDTLAARGSTPETVATDRGYDNGAMHDECALHGAVGIFPLRETPAVKRGEHRAPTCEHGTWMFAGPTSSAARPSGAVPPESASPSPCGGRRPGCTR